MKSSLSLAAFAFVASAAIGLADSISPGSVTASLDVGESLTIKKTVTVSEGPPTSSKVDVFFLADTTGSMGGAIANVKAAAASILSSAAGLGDVAFGVGEYKDVGDVYIYRKNTEITTVQATAQAGINLWGASGGGDTPEANLFALEQVAETTAWRDGSERILVWFGDAPGHDPRAGSTEASATAALQAEGIAVQAISVGFAQLDSSGQATRITAATGGVLYNGISVSDIVDTINDAIETAAATYTLVGIDTSEVPAGVGVSVNPASHSGDFDRSIERTFDFDVTFTGLAPGSYNFNLYGTVDRGRVATEDDHITVGRTGVPDGGASLVLLGFAMTALGWLRRRSA
jgi:hypothetical protein